MTNGEKLEQVFPDGICPFSSNWLSTKYREPKHRPEEYISLPRVKQTICNITAEYDTETIHIDRLMNEIDNLPTISLKNTRGEENETIGRPFDLEKHDKEISDKWINKVKQAREGIQKLVEMCGSDTVADLNMKSGLGMALEKIDKLIVESEE